MKPAIIRNLGVAVAAAVCVTLAPAGHAADAPPACSADAHYNKQDFALGKWDVYSGAHKIGTIHLEKVLNGCGIRETWTEVGKPDGHGMGLFTYSRLLGHWVHFWVEDTGQASELSGDSHGTNDMLYVTDVPQPEGGKKERHWTLKLQPDGSIQELSVASTDGQTWSTEFELIWRKRK